MRRPLGRRFVLLLRGGAAGQLDRFERDGSAKLYAAVVPVAPDDCACDQVFADLNVNCGPNGGRRGGVMLQLAAVATDIDEDPRMGVTCPLVPRRVPDIVAFCPAAELAPPASDEGNCLCDDDDRRDDDDEGAYSQDFFGQKGERICNLSKVLGVAAIVCAAPGPGSSVNRDLQASASQVIQVAADCGQGAQGIRGSVRDYRLWVVKAGLLQQRLCILQKAHEVGAATSHPVAADGVKNVTLTDVGADPAQLSDVCREEAVNRAADEPRVDSMQLVQLVDQRAVSKGQAARCKRAEHQACDQSKALYHIVILRIFFKPIRNALSDGEAPCPILADLDCRTCPWDPGYAISGRKYARR